MKQTALAAAANQVLIWGQAFKIFIHTLVADAEKYH
jgi:hypothetical protein